MTRQRESEMRPAEEIAREMVSECAVLEDPNGQVIAQMQDTPDVRPSVWPRFSRPSGVDDLRAFVARTITRAREEGAAAERARQEPRSSAHVEAIDHYREGLHRIWRGDADPRSIAADYLGEDPIEERPAHVALYPAHDVPGQWIAHHIKRDLVTQGNSETHALRMLAEAIEMADGSTAQPRGLADSIRVMARELIDGGRVAADDTTGVPLIRAGIVLEQAADELEAIVRECAERS